MRCDVCLILEGTYPYVAGGVSTWVAQIIEYMPEVSFGIVYIAANRHEKLTLKYTIPVNVTEIREVYLHDFPRKKSAGRGQKLSAEDWTEMRNFQRSIMIGEPLDVVSMQHIVTRFETVEDFMEAFAYSREAWEAALSLYREFCGTEMGFRDFFWSYRFINLPVLKLLRTEVMPAKIYHAACTGYAATLGTLFSHLTGGALLISEHGIYTRERRIEIFDADWIYGAAVSPLTLDMSRRSNKFKEWWVNLFFSLSRTAYTAATQVYSLFEANRRDQIADGADPQKVQIIPNGIDLSDFLAIPPRRRSAGEELIIGYVGRIAPIKDVKTLIKALDHLKRGGVKFRALLMGPFDEDVGYYEECRELVVRLELEKEAIFTGRIDVKEKLQEIDVGVISSISEGLPFAVLEAGGAGRPFVATDVGSCRELLIGSTAEDRAIGRGGFIVPVSTPGDLAQALKKIADNPELAESMGQNLRERVCRYYDLNGVMNRYRDEYRKCFEQELQQRVQVYADSSRAVMAGRG